MLLFRDVHRWHIPSGRCCSPVLRHLHETGTITGRHPIPDVTLSQHYLIRVRWSVRREVRTSVALLQVDDSQGLC